jgi:hypothetical protein
MSRLLAAAALCCLATLGHAADLDPAYGQAGRITAEVNGATHDLVIVKAPGEEAPSAQRQMIGTQLSVNFVGYTVQQDGTPGAPMVQVTLMGAPESMQLVSAEMFDEQGYDGPLVMDPDDLGGQGAVTDHALDGDVTAGQIEGEFLRLTGYMSEPRVADGAEPMPVTITWEVTLPPMD